MQRIPATLRGGSVPVVHPYEHIEVQHRATGVRSEYVDVHPMPKRLRRSIRTGLLIGRFSVLQQRYVRQMRERQRLRGPLQWQRMQYVDRLLRNDVCR